MKSLIVYSNQSKINLLVGVRVKDIVLSISIKIKKKLLIKMNGEKAVVSNVLTNTLVKKDLRRPKYVGYLYVRFFSNNG